MSKMETASVIVKQSTSGHFEENLFEDALHILDLLWKARLVDRIARPRDKLIKQTELVDFAALLTSLHKVMKRIRSQLIEARVSEQGAIRSKGIVSSTATKAKLDWRKSIKLIESKYNEVLMEGSFKFCRRICELQGLKWVEGLNLMGVEDWADECLENRLGESCC